MADRIQVIIESSPPGASKGEPIMQRDEEFNFIATYDTPQWLTQEEIDRLRELGFTVKET